MEVSYETIAAKVKTQGGYFAGNEKFQRSYECRYYQ